MYFLIDNIPTDGGPVYAETNLQNWFVEPFNAISSLAYLVPAFYWWRKLKGRHFEFAFLSFCLPFLVLGGIGSTLYHAFRNSVLLLYMDVFPIAVVTLMVSIYLWIKVLPKSWFIVFILAPFLYSRYVIYGVVSSGLFLGKPVSAQTVINITYFITGTMIFLPSILLLIKYKFENWSVLVTSCLLFILGLTFRRIDDWDWGFLYMGTHFLWHISTAAGSWMLAEYLYRLRKREIMG
jgi:hemolysin III